jgi:hypothetical protein
MTLHLNIQADVIDIRHDTPRQSDIFLVDTNVWFWQTYSNARVAAQPYQMKHYPKYLTQSLTVGSTLSYSVLTLAELASIIERTELSIFNTQHQSAIRPKEFRHNYPSERANVVREVQGAWSDVEALAVSADLTINDAVAQAALHRFQTQALDGYDLLILEAISRAETGQVKVMTDDVDYGTVPNIQVFTSNNNLIWQAQNQGQLIKR